MKVLDVISEAGNPISWGLKWLSSKAVIEEIAKGWVKEIKLYKKEFGVNPKLDDLMDFAPAEKLTAEKAIARDPAVQEQAYKAAMDIVAKEERAAGLNLAKRGVTLGMKKLGKGALWLSSFLKWGARASLVWGCADAWKEYNSKLNGALDDLGKGGMNGEQFKQFHDRILIEFYGQAAASIGASVVAMGLPKFIATYAGISSGPITAFFGNLVKAATAYGTEKYVLDYLASEDGASSLAYWLTAEGVVDDAGNQIEEPSELGKFIEGLAAKTEYFKKKALEAANKRKLGDKIPPKVLPTPAEQKQKTPAPSAAPAAANDDEQEDEPPVSGGAPQRPAQGAQPAGTSSVWK